MTVYRALVTPVEGTIVATPSDVRQMLVRVGGSVTVSGTGSPTLAGLTDVQVATPTVGQLLRWDGTKWVNATPASPDHVYTFAAPINVPLTGTNAAMGGFLTGDVEVFLKAQTNPAENNRGYHYDFETDTLTPDGFVVDAAHGGQTVLIVSDGTASVVKPDGSGGWELGSFDVDVSGVKVVGQSGLLSDYNNGPLEGLLQGVEGRNDAKRYANFFVLSSAIDDAGGIDVLTAGAVADEDQPLDYFGDRITKTCTVTVPDLDTGDPTDVVMPTLVGVLSDGPFDVGGLWFAEIAATGQWLKRSVISGSVPDGATTNALAGGSSVLTLNGDRAEFVPLDLGTGFPNFKQSQFGADSSIPLPGMWAVTPGKARFDALAARVTALEGA